MRILILALLLGSTFVGCSHASGPPSESPDLGTAASEFSSVDSLARSINGSLRLVMVASSRVSPDGFSRVWIYAYEDIADYSGSYWFHADLKGIKFDSISGLQFSASVITHKWCNSDSAMHVAEREGGADYREENPCCTMTASLGELAIPNAATRWWIIYNSCKNPMHLLFAIDACTGQVILQGP